MKADATKKKDNQNIKLNELILVKKIAQGQFGPLYLVRAKYNNQLYVLKAYSKQMIVEQNLEKHLQV